MTSADVDTDWLTPHHVGTHLRLDSQGRRLGSVLILLQVSFTYVLYRDGRYSGAGWTHP